MKYRQAKVADKSVQATDVQLKVHGRWLPGILLDKNGNHLPLPCDVVAGETYLVEADDKGCTCITHAGDPQCPVHGRRAP